MWCHSLLHPAFSEKTCQIRPRRRSDILDSAALAVYRKTFRGLRLERFASERFASRAGQAALFKDVLSDSKGAVERLARDLKAPSSGATLLLPLGASFPSVLDLASLTRGRGAEVDEHDVVRFRLSPLLPFPITQAEVRTETSPSIGHGLALAQAILKSLIAESERMMESLGFPRVSVTTALSAALRGLGAQPGLVDLILGDAACAIAVRDAKGRIAAIHLRLLLPGDDRAQRALGEALRSIDGSGDIRVAGESVDAFKRHALKDNAVRAAYDLPALRGFGDPQEFPFLGVFHEPAAR